MTIRTVIVDNERAVRKNLSLLLKEYSSEIELLGEADGVTSSLQLILEKAPELVFLDVEMDDGTGFDLIRKLESPMPAIIFVTAHDHYALEAIKVSAVDYLLKPVNPDDLLMAIARTKQTLESSRTELQTLLSNLQAENLLQQKILLKESEAIHVVLLSDLVACEADGSYTIFHIEGNKKIIVSGNLKEYEKKLPSKYFVRTHHAFLANLSRVKKFDKPESLLLMDDGREVFVSTRKKEEVLKQLELLH